MKNRLRRMALDALEWIDDVLEMVGVILSVSLGCAAVLLIPVLAIGLVVLVVKLFTGSL